MFQVPIESLLNKKPQEHPVHPPSSSSSFSSFSSSISTTIANHSSLSTEQEVLSLHAGPPPQLTKEAAAHKDVIPLGRSFRNGQQTPPVVTVNTLHLYFLLLHLLTSSPFSLSCSFSFSSSPSLSLSQLMAWSTRSSGVMPRWPSSQAPETSPTAVFFKFMKQFSRNS